MKVKNIKLFGVSIFFVLLVISRQSQVIPEDIHKHKLLTWNLTQQQFTNLKKENQGKNYYSLCNIPFNNSCDSLQMVDVFLPIDKEPSPVIVFFHGGGWIHGDKSSFREMGRKLALNGVIAVIANYRLSPKIKHPAHIQDVSSAVKWVWNNINNLRGDTTRIYLTGHSAGAHLATLLVTNEKYLIDNGMSTNNIAGVISISGIFLIAPNPEGATEKFIKSIFGDSPSTWNEASPILNLQNKNPRLPKLLVTWYKDENNLIVQENENWINELKKSNHEFETLILAGSSHDGFINTLGNKDDELTNHIYNFIGVK